MAGQVKSRRKKGADKPVAAPDWSHPAWILIDTGSMRPLMTSRAVLSMLGYPDDTPAFGALSELMRDRDAGRVAEACGSFPGDKGVTALDVGLITAAGEIADATLSLELRKQKDLESRILAMAFVSPGGASGDHAGSKDDGRVTRMGSEQSEQLYFLENLEKIDRAVRQSINYTQMINSVFGLILEIIGCDRVGLLYPCDPEASCYRVEHESAGEGFESGQIGEEFPMDPRLAVLYRKALGTDKALTCGPEEDFNLPGDIPDSLSIKWQIIMALRPQVGEPWFFCVQQCKRPRRWTEQERSIFQEIGRRLNDSLSILLILRNIEQSEAMYRALFEQAADAIQILDGDIFVDCNEAGLRLLGINDRSRFKKVPPWVFSPEFQPDGRRSDEKAREMIAEGRRKGYHRFEWVHQTIDGRPFWVDVTLARVDYEEREIIYSIWRDIDEKKKTMLALEESERNYREIFNASTEMILVSKCHTLETIDCNETLLRCFGYTREEVLSLGIGDLSLGTEPYTYEAAVEHSNRAYHGDPQTFEWLAKKKNGELFWVEVSLKRASIGGRDCMLTFLHDITERKKADEAIATRLRYEKALATCSRSLLESAVEEEAINFTLQNLLEASGACRIYMFENFVDSGGCLAMRQTHEFCAHGVTPQLENPELAHLPYDPDFTRWKAVLEKGGEVNGIVAGFPQSERKVLQPQEIVSLLAIPVFVGGQWYGFVGFDDTLDRKVWGAEDVSLLRTAAQMIGAYFHQRHTMQALTESVETFRALTENSPDAIMRFDRQFRHLYVNKAAEDQGGIGLEEFFGRTHREMGFPDDLVEVIEDAIGKVFETAGPFRCEFTLPNGTMIDWLLFPEFDEKGRVEAVITSARDITDRINAENERIRLEEQLRQAQKMETVGRLAGGVAHDFNNMLTPILGYSEVLLSDIDDNDPGYQLVQDIREAAERAGSLTKQLLAFSRKQVLDLRVVNLNRIITEFGKMLQRLIGEHIHFRAMLDPTLGNINADPDQIQQVLMNLAVNARDSMPRGGMLTLKTLNVELDESRSTRAAFGELAPGPYVKLIFSDTGVGMDKKTLDNIFDPFFTTKEKGKGTGLGLSIVYGIVQQHGGGISVSSEKGKGTVFEILLPRIDQAEQGNAKSDRQAGVYAGYETVLVVEDEPKVRKLASRILESNGYRVTSMAGPKEALELAAGSRDKIDLLLTDVVMPGMNGRELYEKMKSIYPGIRVLFMSGYTDELIVHHGVLEDGVTLLEKPFTILDLLGKVRSVLD